MIRRLLSLAVIVCLAAALEGGAAAQANERQYIVNGRLAAGAAAEPGDDVKSIEPSGAGMNLYTDPANGYSIRYPAHMTVDAALSAVRTVFSDEQTRIEVYYDQFSGTSTTADDYIQYGNKFVKASPRHAVTADYWTEVSGYSTHVLKWARQPLARVPDDRPNYVCAEIVKNSREVYTVFIKSREPLANAGEIIASLRIVPRQGAARNDKDLRPSATAFSEETRSFYHQYFGVGAPQRWGIFEPSAPQSMNRLGELENQLEHRFAVLLHYQMFDDYFPVYGLQNAYENGRYVELTLQTTYAGEVNALWQNSSRNLTMVYDILDGKYDDYFADYARKLKEFGHPVLFRLNNEMNGDWCWYSAYYTGKDTELYKALWRYVHAVFERNGVDNVIWVWNPHDRSLPDFKWNNYLMYYPGDECVDVIGLTGYNTGNYFPGETWREFAEIYPPLYNESVRLFDKPLMITEFASNSAGGDKAAWIGQMFGQLKELDRIKVAVWWSGVDYDREGRPGRVYLIDENDEVVKAFRTGLKDFAQ